MTHNRTYIAWRNMRRRCSSPRDASWENYGGRGIAVCEAWSESYEHFAADMGEVPDGLTLERIDYNGNYEPGNCRWATWKEQHNNTRRTVLLTRDGVTKSMTAWAETAGISPDTLWRRLNRYGRTLGEALTPGRLRTPRPAKHGTRLKYGRDRCRCSECRAYNTARGRAWRSKHAL
jgi:hypothetical protein